MTFPKYRILICRRLNTDLKKTTMATFFTVCPKEFILSHNGQEGITYFINGSLVYWMHLDAADENTFRGIEANAIAIDQAEETTEQMFDIVEARLGRWAWAEVPQNLIDTYPDWPLHKIKGTPIAPSYMMMAVNPDTQYHYIYRKGHPDSLERLPYWGWAHGEWDANLGSIETYNEKLKSDPEWVKKYMKGEWGISSAQIHYLPPEGILEPTESLIDKILIKGNLFRSMDHGETAPTCCLWFAALEGVYICYREYYVPGRVISYHRTEITNLSFNEKYSNSYADPSIFKKDPDKRNQDGTSGTKNSWSVADEYRTNDLDAPAMFWTPADNNEFATRNRINELLTRSDKFIHPVTGATSAIGLYYIKATPTYPNGCKQSIIQLGAQRRKELGTIDGKMYYEEERDDKVVDHAYDPTRYFVAMHGTQPRKSQKAPPRNSLAYFNAIMARNKHRDIEAGQN